MSILQGIENVKYRFVLDLIKNEENYDKKLKVISGLEAFYLCHERYKLLQNVLLPLKNLLGDDTTITSVGFTNDMQSETGIAIKYVKNSNPYIIIIRLYDLEVFDISVSSQEFDSDEFLETNRNFINEIVNELNSLGYIDEPEISLKSSSKRFIINDNSDDFIIKANDEKLFSIGTNHYLYDKNEKLLLPDKIISDNAMIKEWLVDEEKIQKIYSNIRINEEDFPKRLIKKIR